MTRRHFLRNFVNNFSSYEISFLAENIVVAFLINLKWTEIDNYIYKFTGILLLIIVTILNLTVIGINFMKFNTKKNVRISYKLDRYFIIPLNILKAMGLSMINTYFLKINCYNIKLYLLFTLILVLFTIANIKYYSVLIKTKERVIRK